MARKALGKGITSLIPTAFEMDSDIDGGVLEVDIDKIVPNENQPRKYFDESSLNELAESINSHGLIQPLVVNSEDGNYKIITGERRWRAAKIAGLSKLPVIVKDYSVEEIIEVSLIENIQREDLNPIEEAEAYNILLKEFGMTQEQLSIKIGKSRAVITNAIRLLNLDSRVKNFVIENKLSNGHARAILSLENGDLQFEVAEKVIENGLSVRQTESLVKSFENNVSIQQIDESEEKSSDENIDSIYRGIEREFSEILGTKVQIMKGKKKSKIEIEYYSDDDLDRLVTLIKGIENVSRETLL